ncbi:hypothetical protein D1007_46408 [Hordeum vulgare]|nr:hypothetical protein D1007_46408 [Hordeum vulgare]
MLLKIDNATVFDLVSWPFLRDTLRYLGFGDRWREWISIFLSTTSTRVLVNSVPDPSILHACGLQQGDPVFPMIFVLVIDVLNSLFHRLTTRHLASSVSLYTDDFVIFFHPDAHDIRTVRGLIDTFGMALGLRANFAKCPTLPIRCTDEHINTIVAEMSCPMTEFPVRYLGLPLSIRKPSTSGLMPLVERLEKKLST